MGKLRLLLRWKIRLGILALLLIGFQNCGQDFRSQKLENSSTMSVPTPDNPMVFPAPNPPDPGSQVCDEGWIRVPAKFSIGGRNHQFGLNEDFCIMKFEAQKAAENGRFIPVSQYSKPGNPSKIPWVDIGMMAAEAECSKVGGRLPTPLEAKIVSQNIMLNPANWQPKTAGAAPIIGQGCMYGGHLDGYPRHVLPSPQGNDQSADPYYGTLSNKAEIANRTPGACPFVTTEYLPGTNTPDPATGGYKSNGIGSRRTLYLSNDEVIWDWSGNVWEWLRGHCLNFTPSEGRFKPAVFSSASGNGIGYWDFNEADHPLSGNPNRPSGLYTEWTRHYLADHENPTLGPYNPEVEGSQLLNSNHGIGMYWGCNRNSNGFLRGGASYSGREGGAFSTQLGHFVVYPDPNENGIRTQWMHARVGFRCVKDLSTLTRHEDKTFKIIPETIFPNKQSIAPKGVFYSTAFPQTLDLAKRAEMYLKGMTSSLIPEHGYAAPHPGILYSKPSSEVEACEGKPPCFEFSKHSQSLWGKVALSLAQAREMSGYDLEDRDGTLNIQWQMIKNMFNSKYTDKVLPPVGLGVTTTTTAQEALMQIYAQHSENQALFEANHYLVEWHKSRLRRLPDSSNRVFYFFTNLFEAHGITYPSNLYGPLGNQGYYSWDQFIQGKALIAFMDWTRLSEDANTRSYGNKIGDYLIGFDNSKFWRTDEFGIPTEKGGFVGHMHSYLQTVLGNLARVREMRRVGESPAKADAILEHSVATYEYIKRKTGAGVVGNFGEIGTVGDMVRAAIEISDLGGYDYYDDADRWVRNQLVESQIDPEMASHIPNRSSADFKFDRIGQKVVGSFISDATHSLAIPKNKNFRWNVDGCANALRGMYEAWKSIVQVKGGFARVNLLLNRSHKLLDVKSELPYRGYVQVQLKNIKGQVNAVGIRVPGWVDKSQVRVTDPNGKNIEWSWMGQFAIVRNIQNGQLLAVHFPMRERVLGFTTLRSQKNWWYEGVITSTPNWIDRVEHRGLFRGNTLVKVLTPLPAEPPEGQIPRFQRQNLADLPLTHSTAAPWETEERFYLVRESP